MLTLLVFFYNGLSMDKLLLILQNPAHRSSLAVHFPSLPVNSIYLLLCLPIRMLCADLYHVPISCYYSYCPAVCLSWLLHLNAVAPNPRAKAFGRAGVQQTFVASSMTVSMGKKWTCEAVFYTLCVSDGTKQQ